MIPTDRLINFFDWMSSCVEVSVLLIGSIETALFPSGTITSW
ncbi:hypothetical protein M6B38_320415 [Iris pallida]|uniref:Uncharacterized protein n=1 Tax=Iris pallida TaxID=29817 RepID=A0AAX6HBB2_IRIPA|nr:hypothetical protein M6B38_320415 [Iris pallida]